MLQLFLNFRQELLIVNNNKFRDCLSSGNAQPAMNV